MVRLWSVLAAGIAALTAIAAAAADIEYPVASGQARHAVIVFIDGGHPELYTAETTPHIAALARVGARFARAEVGFPSDSMPGILGPLTGAPPRVTGVPYDVYFDRSVGDRIEMTEEIHVPAGKQPHHFLRVPTLFEAAKERGLKTAFVSKHVGYEVLQGPSGKGVDQLALPELAEFKGTPAAFDAANFALLRGWLAKGEADIAGIYATAPNYVMKEFGLAAPETLASVHAIDAEIGRIVETLREAGRYDDTVIVVTSDHGNSETPRAIAKSGEVSVSGLLAANGIKVAHVTYDNVAIVYLADPQQKEAATALLLAPEAKERLGIDRLLERDELVRLAAFADEQMPDFVVLCRPDVVYTKLPAKKKMEHGGLNEADRRVPLVIAGPGIKPGVAIEAPAATNSIGPTLAKLLGLRLPAATAPVLADALK
jgi:predicted AlkP superfamily pyrophosphatase or phosphodiesterase